MSRRCFSWSLISWILRVVPLKGRGVFIDHKTFNCCCFRFTNKSWGEKKQKTLLSSFIFLEVPLLTVQQNHWRKTTWTAGSRLILHCLNMAFPAAILPGTRHNLREREKKKVRLDCGSSRAGTASISLRVSRLNEWIRSRLRPSAFAASCYLRKIESNPAVTKTACHAFPF